MSEHFGIVGDAIAPQPWMQMRHLKGAEVPSVSKSYDTSGGGNKNDAVHAVVVSWTNNTPIPQSVYGMVTREGAQVTLQARSRGYLLTLHGRDITATAAVPTSWDMAEVSKFGIGGDIGKGGILALGTGFGVSEIRQNSASIPLMPHWTGWSIVAPGQTFHGRVEVRFRTDFWENTSIDGGDQNTESGFISGGTRLDLYATPVIGEPPVLSTPTVVGIEHSVNNTFHTDVDVPAGTALGDMLIAVVSNQFGLISDIKPEQTGWTQVHARDGGWEDAHMKVYVRAAKATEPASYTFGNGLLAESIAHLITVRGANQLLDEGWQFASSLRKRWWERYDGHICPSIDRAGQLLLLVSYIPHNALQTTLTQTVPAGTTELENVDGNLACSAVAALPNPPRPTGERTFVASEEPSWAGRSITASILVPGTFQ
ncbi:Uncharacterised protein [Mycobacteroides abscessus subsp. abscessus]|uniref:DUF7172 domain-containing protein n=1 Tax=Mycobacteroides abscessus subsp. massiliense TaxID=1962118 RepID=A0A1U0QHQ6_9MYCO|nr:hypothetical protein [Mycobacteroides abscessus]SHV92443.1 Uncharacterised protein [Mycobacteroides abscessus subsp. abscessus]SHW15385.1 Uncharacterised protein [Mycobacteroides abscessus subsp. abscessus]SHW41207.1 Uncharacterised protein [Mycobacteroides abscessus subsp. abscessus]SIA97019.1 Uncharacterised protein [Mycobacteroides abscessus subsp. abscessus]SIB35561.1 Uncharacterised protein [Mycobacteroides abscessus subsp. abscessus]